MSRGRAAFRSKAAALGAAVVLAAAGTGEAHPGDLGVGPPCTFALGAGAECFACPNGRGMGAPCMNRLARHGFALRCTTHGHEVWYELWCRRPSPASSPLPDAVRREVLAEGDLPKDHPIRNPWVSPPIPPSGPPPPAAAAPARDGARGCGGCAAPGTAHMAKSPLLVLLSIAASMAARRRPGIKGGEGRVPLVLAGRRRTSAKAVLGAATR